MPPEESEGAALTSTRTRSGSTSSPITRRHDPAETPTTRKLTPDLPLVSITIPTDTRAHIMIDGVQHTVDGADLAQVRQEALQVVLELVAYPTQRAARVVVLDSTGSSTLTVRPDGAVLHEEVQSAAAGSSGTQIHVPEPAEGHSTHPKERERSAVDAELPRAQDRDHPRQHADQSARDSLATGAASGPVNHTWVPHDEQGLRGSPLSPGQSDPAPERFKAGAPTASMPAPEPMAPPTLQHLLEERRQLPPAAATQGWQGVVHRVTRGLISPAPGDTEAARRRDIARLQVPMAGPRTIVVVNPKGGAHKTTSTLLLAAQLGLHRGASTLAWDNNETRGTLGWASQPGTTNASAVDLLAELTLRHGGHPDRARTIASYLTDNARAEALHARIRTTAAGELLPAIAPTSPLTVGDLCAFVRPQGWGHFHVLASPEADEDSDGGADLVGRDGFVQLHRALSALYEVLIIDTGNNIRAANWRAAIDHADELVIVSTIRESTAQSASWMLDALQRRGKGDLIARSVTVLSEPAGSLDAELRLRLERHFGARTRAVLSVPHDDALVAGGAINFSALAPRTRDAWLAVGAAATEGL